MRCAVGSITANALSNFEIGQQWQIQRYSKRGGGDKVKMGLFCLNGRGWPWGDGLFAGMGGGGGEGVAL